MVKEHHTPEANRIFCSSISGIYGAMINSNDEFENGKLSSQALRDSEELLQVFGENRLDEMCFLMRRFLRGEEITPEHKQEIGIFLQSLLKGKNQKIIDEILNELVFLEDPQLSRIDILASLDQIKESKKFLEDFFLKEVRKPGTDEDDFSKENFETVFTSDHLINALRADIKLATPEIKLRMDIENRNQYDEVGPWHKDLAVFTKDRNNEKKDYGIVNKQGKEILEAQDIYVHLHDDYIRIGNKFYDHTMKLTHDLSAYRFVVDPSEGLIGVKGWDERQGTHYIDQHTGEKVITLDPMINYIGQFKDGLAKVRYGKRVRDGPRGLSGYINREGKIVIPCAYDACSQNENGYMLATAYGPVGDGIDCKLYLLHYDGTESTEDLIDPEDIDAWKVHEHFHEGSDRDKPGFVDGKFILFNHDYHRDIVIDTEGNAKESEEKIIEMKSGIRVIIDYKIKEKDKPFDCKILDKDGKQIDAPSAFIGVNKEDDIIFVGDGIVTPDGEYIGPLKERVLRKYFWKNL